MSQNQSRGQAERPKIGAGLAARLPDLVAAWRGSRGPGGAGKGSPLSRREIESASAALLRLQRGLTGDRRLAGSGYMDDPELLGAYLLYYWPVSYLQVSLAFAELRSALGPGGSIAPRRVLDLGCGPGPAAAAVLDACPSASELVLVDSSEKALGMAQSILEARAEPRLRITRELLDLESDAALPEGPFDLAVMGHCVNELWRGDPSAIDRRLLLLKRAARALSPGGLVLVLEPALLLTSRELIALRDRLAQEGWRVLAPCPGSYACPIYAAGAERSCHAESPWKPGEPMASMAAAAGLDRSSVKCAYFFLSPPSSDSRPEEGARACRRVVSDPMLNKAGRLRYILCGEGGLATVSARADDEAARVSGFMDLRRGDGIRLEGFEERPGGGLGFAAGSVVETLALAPEASAPGATA
jgi:SAM-dependent methyltransferase